MDAKMLDRFGRKTGLKTAPKTIGDLLSLNGIPASSVVVEVNNIPALLDHQLLDCDSIQAKMLRTYHLREFLDPPVIRCSDEVMPPRYCRQEAIAEEDGTYNLYVEELSGNSIEKAVEERFIASVDKYNLLPQNQKFLLGISGGRDSLALLRLLRKFSHERNWEISLVHLSATVPEYESKVVRREAEIAGMPLIEFDEHWVRRKFNIDLPLADFFKYVRESGRGFDTINLLHAFTCAALEDAGSQEGIKSILYGLMREDVAATALRRLLLGMPAEEPLRKRWGEFTYIYPLWHLTKRDVYEYVQASTPLHSHQSDATTEECGEAQRDQMYFLTDVLESASPGILSDFIAGLQDAAVAPPEHKELTCCQCDNCFQAASEMAAARICPICDLVNLISNEGSLRRKLVGRS